MKKRQTTKTRTLYDARKFVFDRITQHFTSGALTAITDAQLGSFVVVVEVERNQLVARLIRRRAASAVAVGE